MWSEIFKLAMSNGIWAVLFLGLLIYQLKDSATREKKYQKTIDNLVSSLSVVEQIKEEVEDIKIRLEGVNPKNSKGETLDERET